MMTFSTYHKIFINVITNNIHRSPKLIRLSAFYLRRPAADPLVWRQRRARPAGRWFSRWRRQRKPGGGRDSPFLTTPPPHLLNGLFEHLHLELIPLKWMCTLGDDISLSGADSHSVCAPPPRSSIHNRFLSFNAPRSNVTLIIKRLISLTWVMPGMEKHICQMFPKGEESH